MKQLLYVLGGSLLGFCVLVIFLSLFNVGLKSLIMPMEEEVRRETYEESRTHVQGTVDDLYGLRVKWANADKEHRDMLEGMILRRARDVESDELPSDIRTFVDSLRSSQ